MGGKVFTGKLVPRKDLGKLLYCSSLLEERVANAYEHIAKLIGDRLIAGLLGFIAHDSFKHAEYFRVISEWLLGDIKVCFEECEGIWGEAWKTLVTDAEKFLGKSTIDFKDLTSLINGLTKIKGFVAEEYLTIATRKINRVNSIQRGIKS
jgi:hypothetical protein